MPHLKRFSQIEKIDDFSFHREPQHEYQVQFDREFILKGLVKPKPLDDLESTIPRVLSEETKRAVINVIKKTCNDIKVGKTIDSTPAKKISEKLVKEVISNRKAMLELFQMKSFEEYTFVHSINVCLISILVGIEMGYTESDLKKLAGGALFHDIGRLKLPKELLDCSRSLTPKELSEIKQHPIYGLEIIKDDEIDEISRVIILQHHERNNGQGYPYGLKGTEIHPAAVICGLADVYDALTSKRPYRNALMPYEAMKHIVIASADNFRPEITGCFLRSLSIYPMGSLVKLNTGEIGRVVRANRKAVMRPVVRFLLDYEGEPFADLIEIDLTQHPHRYIAEAVNEEVLKAKASG
ncbi:MAG: HD-GYP domain-containing protein [bacterium]|nr:HD-GYP domain-containing protein [bacterium]